MKQALLIGVLALSLSGCAVVLSSAASGLTDSISDSVLNQDDPATLGRLMTYYRYLSDYRGDNIAAVNNHIAELAALRAEGVAYAVPDAVADRHLRHLGRALRDHALVTGGSGIALGLPDNFRAKGLLERHDAAALPAVDGLEAVLAGSCSTATLGQIDRMARVRPALKLDPFALAEGYAAELAVDWVRQHAGAGLLWNVRFFGQAMQFCIVVILTGDQQGGEFEPAVGFIVDVFERIQDRLQVPAGELMVEVLGKRLQVDIGRVHRGEELGPGLGENLAGGDRHRGDADDAVAAHRRVALVVEEEHAEVGIVGVGHDDEYALGAFVVNGEASLTRVRWAGCCHAAILPPPSRPQRSLEPGQRSVELSSVAKHGGSG